MGCMPASDVAPLPRLGEVFFDVRGNSRTMRLSWYTDTGVAVFSIWQGATCTATFRVPIADLPRLVEALQRGPQGVSAAGSEVPGTGSRSIQGYEQSGRGHSGYQAGGYQAGGYETHRYERGVTEVSADPLSPPTAGGEYPARGRHAVSAAAQGRGGGGYPEPPAEPGPAPPGAPHRGYPDVGGYGSPADAGAPAGYVAAAYDGYPDPDDIIRQAEPLAAPGPPSPGYPSPGGYPHAGEPAGEEAYGQHGLGSSADPAQRGSYAGYHNDRSATGYAAADTDGRIGYPGYDGRSHGPYAGTGTGGYGSFAEPGQPARYPEPAGSSPASPPPAGMSAPGEHTALMPADPGPPTVGMPPATEGSHRPDPAAADSAAPYPPDPYLDGPLPPADQASAEPRPARGQRRAAADPWRAEDGPMSSRYGYPPSVDH